MIVHVHLRDAGEDKTLFSEYVDVQAETTELVVKAALAKATLRTGQKKGGKPDELAARKDVIVSMYCDDIMSTQTIAGVLGGVSSGTVGRFLRKNGVTLRKPGKPKTPHSQEMRRKVIGLYVRGMSKDRVREETGLSEYAVNSILKEAGVLRRRGRPTLEATSALR